MSEGRRGITRTQPLHPRKRTLRQENAMDKAAAKEEENKSIEWMKPVRHTLGEHLTRNLAVASALVLCAVALRQGAVPSLQGATDAIVTAVTSDTLLDDTLGKLSFVSSMFPEATLVFGEQRDAVALPVSGGSVVHTWSVQEPYMAWRGGSSEVKAALEGEVIGVYHGYGEERLVQIMGSRGLSCLYGNLDEVALQIGDRVSVGDTVGTVLAGEDCVFEVRRDGVSIDPSVFMKP